MKFYLIPIVLLFACTATTDTESKLYGKWEYERIEQNDSSIVEIRQGDEMELFIDHLFTYHIKNANKHENGSWKLFGDTLQFKYEPHGKSRSFEIVDISDSKLTIREEEVYFYFNKED